MARRKKPIVGRPSKLTPKTVEKIKEALMVGATHQIACLSAGIAAGTFYLWIRKAEAVLARLDEESEKANENKAEIEAAKLRGDEPPEPYEPDMEITAHEKDLIKFLHTINEAEAVGALQHLENLKRFSSQDPDISQWILQNRHGYGREQHKQRLEVSGPDGGPIETADTSGLTPEERIARLAQLLATAAQRKNNNADDDSGAND
jgi:hypothetical protein